MDVHEISQDNLFTAAQAGRIGLGPVELRRLLRAGAIRRPIRGWYAVPTPGAPAHPWDGADRFEAERNWHRTCTHALLRSFDGRVVASHQSALILYGVDVWPCELSIVHVARRGDDHTRHRRGAIIHPQCGLDPVTLSDGFRCVPAAVAVVQVGLRPLGHGEAAPIASLVAADHALRLGLVQHGDIADAITLHERHPGIPAVRAVLAHADGRHESVGETRMMFNLRALGYQIEPQRLVPGLRYRVDGKLKGHDVYIEFDGMKKYLPTGPLSTADELAARRAIAEEKARQDAISATGAVFVRFTWADLASLGTMAAKMRDAIRRAELLRSAGASVR